MARRKGQASPFEIMRRFQPDQSPAPQAQGDQASSEQKQQSQTSAWRQASTDHASGSLGAWTAWVRGGAPIMLRVPRGVALLVIFGVLAILLLAYFTGHYRGVSQGEQNILSQMDAGRQAISRNQPTVGSQGQGRMDDARRGRVYMPNDADPRVPEMNYFVLARYPLDEAQRLGEFLADQGLDTVIVPSHNSGLFQVIALVGYTAEQYRAGEHHDFVRVIHQIGERWRAFNSGRGDDLRSRTYWAKYEP